MEDYYCKYCDYQAKNKYTFKKHLQTKKHAKNLALFQEEEPHIVIAKMMQQMSTIMIL